MTAGYHWTKIGRVFRSAGQFPWMISHATHPLVLPLGSERVRIYFSSRDAEQRSHLSFIELDITNPALILRVSERPALSPGPLGFFDDFGVYGSCLVAQGDALWLYYLGWNRGSVGPLFYSSLGLAVSSDGGETFVKQGSAPILDRGPFDPASVLLADIVIDGAVWRMWYGSGIGWRQTEDGLKSRYDIKYAESTDGLTWRRDGRVCISLRPGESNVGHPRVLPLDGGYDMWYSVDRGNGYRIGWAVSENGLDWCRRDEDCGIPTGAAGWDAESISHPHVFRHPRGVYMAYSGNGFGREGMGLAVAR